MFIPSTKRPPLATWAEPHRYATIYPSAGFSPTPPPPRDRAHWPDRSVPRAPILNQRAEPRSTSQLVALTGTASAQSADTPKPSSTSNSSRQRRSGRSVLSYRTPLGDSLTDAD